MFNKETIGKMKKGSFLVNNARGAICDPPAVVEALKSGQLRGTARSHHLETFRIPPSNAPLLARRQCHSKQFKQGDLLQAYSKQHVLLRCVQPGANLWRPSTRRRWLGNKTVVLLAGYSGDVWPQQPAPPDHPWRKMPRHAMTPHYSGAL